MKPSPSEVAQARAGDRGEDDSDPFLSSPFKTVTVSGVSRLWSSRKGLAFAEGEACPETPSPTLSILNLRVIFYSVDKTENFKLRMQYLR